MIFPELDGHCPLVHSDHVSTISITTEYPVAPFDQFVHDAHIIDANESKFIHVASQVYFRVMYPHDVHITTAFPSAHVAPFAHAAHAVPAAQVSHFNPIDHVAHLIASNAIRFIQLRSPTYFHWRYVALVHNTICFPSAHVTPLIVYPLIRLYIAPEFDAINVPLAFVPSMATFGILATDTLPWNHPCHPDHSKTMPVAVVLLPSAVRNIVFR